MKKSKVISLVLISASLAGCHAVKSSLWDNSHDAVYWDNAIPRTDATRQDSTFTSRSSHLWLWHNAFLSYRRYHTPSGRIHGAPHGTAHGTTHGVVAARSVRGGFGKGFAVAS